MGASASTSLAGKHVVVVGGSFGAKSAVHELEQRGARVTLVAPSDRLFVVFGAVRAAAVAGFEDALLVPWAFKNKASAQVRALAVGVDAAAKTVRAQPVDAHGRADAAAAAVEIPFDFCVLATGLHAAAPWRATPSVAHFKHELAAMRAAIAGARSVCVVGGGSAGVELAGELKHANPALAVSLVTSGAALLENDPVHPMLRALILAECARLGISVTLGARVEGLGLLASRANVAEVSPGVYAARKDTPAGAAATIELALSASGKAGAAAAAPPPALSADVVFHAVSAGKPATQWLAGSAASVTLNKDGYVEVDTSYLVKGGGAACVFAIGDAAATPELKVAWFTKAQGAIVAHNAAALSRAGGDAAKAQLKRGPAKALPAAVFIVPVGPKGGFAQLPGIFRPNFLSGVSAPRGRRAFRAAARSRHHPRPPPRRSPPSRARTTWPT